MGKADEYLIKERYENRLLTKSSMERALRIAEEHMPRIESGATKVMRAAIPSTTEDEQPGSEKPKADLSPGEVRKLRTLLSQTGKASGDSGSQRTTGTKRPRPDSGHDRDAKGGQRKRVPYAELPECGKCGGKHPGADKGECRLFDRISSVMEKKGVPGTAKAKVMATKLASLDADGEGSGDEYENESPR
eukprot:3931741-Rhodomonas_salina.1